MPRKSLTGLRPRAPGPIDQRGRPAQDVRRAKQEKAIQLATRDPTRTKTSLAAEVGISEQGFRNWETRFPEFKRRLAKVRETKAGMVVPPVPSFKEFRAKYLSEWEENSITGRRMDVGVTHPYMEPFVSALSNDKERRILALWPIRHGKSRIVEHFVVYCLAHNPKARIALVCGSLDLAKDRIYAIQQMLEDTTGNFEELHKLWGGWIGKPEGHGKKWTNTMFYVAGRQDTERDPSVRAFGAGSKILGIRADLIILDDIDDPSNGPEDRRTILRAVNTGIRTRLNEGGRVVVIGNRCGQDDIYASFLGRKGWWRQILSAYQEDGSPLCEAMYSAQELEELAEDMTPSEFALMVLNEPSLEEGVLFPRPLVEAAFGAFDIGEAPDRAEISLSFDPAPVGRAALVALAHHLDTGEVRVLDLDVRAGAGYEGLFQMLSAMVLRYRPRYVVVEQQGGSSPALGDYPEVRSFLIAENVGFEKFTTGANKNDPRVGIAVIKDLLVRGRLKIPWGSDDARRKMKPLVDDLISFQPVFTNRRRYDTVMALWFGANIIQKGRTQGQAPRVVDPMYAKRGGRARIRGLGPGNLPNGRIFQNQKVGLGRGPGI